MRKIIILAGNGELPYLIVKSIKKRNFDYSILTFEKNTISSKLKNVDSKKINFGKIVTEIKKLKKQSFNELIMVGGLSRPNITDIRPDINSIKIVPSFIKKIIEGGDNNLLSFAIKKINEMGIKVLDVKNILPDCFLKKGIHSQISPSKECINNIQKGRKILDTISKFDIGQSIIMQNGSIIGIETVQGTDSLLKQSKKFINKNDDSILVKLCKKNQDLRVDLPTIGMKTLHNCNKINISGIAFSAGKTIFINKHEIIKYCNKNKLFLLGI